MAINFKKSEELKSKVRALIWSFKSARMLCPSITLSEAEFEKLRKYLHCGDGGKEGFWFEGAWVKSIKHLGESK